MYTYGFNIESPLHYHMTGKFRAPSEDWKHLSFPLDDYELFIITEGTLYIGDNNGEYEVHTGEHLLLTPTPNNKRFGLKSSNCSFYWLHFSSNQPIQYVNSLHNSSDDKQNTYIQIPDKGTLESLEKVIILMKQLQDSLRSGYNTIYLNYTTTIILGELSHQYRIKTNTSSKQQSQIYNDIKDYIRLTLHSNLKVSHIANYFGYNEKYLSHLFSNIEGIPLKQYILSELMEEAKYKLTDTNDTINQIASLLGYSDSHNFMKTFKKITGLTPSEYRNAYVKRLLYDK